MPSLPWAARPPSDAQAAAWSAIEWQLYLEALPSSMPLAFLADLDDRFRLTASRNYDVVEKWLVLAVQSDYQPAFARLEAVLATMGRMKYLRPLYRALEQRDPALLDACLRATRPRYHPIARQVIASMLGVESRIIEHCLWPPHRSQRALRGSSIKKRPGRGAR